SENLRVSPPALKSLKRFVDPEQLWPAHYTGRVKHGNSDPWPPGWMARTSAEGWRKIPAVEEFYDADTPEELIYNFGAAHGKYLRKTVEQYRRGKPYDDALGER